jgi:uncharacterized protein YciU (UPF0263 family)
MLLWGAMPRLLAADFLKNNYATVTVGRAGSTTEAIKQVFALLLLSTQYAMLAD